MDVVGGIGQATKRLPWWVIPLGGAAVGVVVLVSRSHAPATVADQAAPAPDTTTQQNALLDAFHQLQQQEATDVQGVGTALQASIAQQESLNTDIQANQASLAASLAALLAPPPPPIPITSDVASSSHHNQHHIDSNDKKEHRRRQEKKGQVGHK